MDRPRAGRPRAGPRGEPRGRGRRAGRRRPGGGSPRRAGRRPRARRRRAAPRGRARPRARASRGARRARTRAAQASGDEPLLERRHDESGAAPRACSSRLGRVRLVVRGEEDEIARRPPAENPRAAQARCRSAERRRREARRGVQRDRIVDEQRARAASSSGSSASARPAPRGTSAARCRPRCRAAPRAGSGPRGARSRRAGRPRTRAPRGRGRRGSARPPARPTGSPDAARRRRGGSCRSGASGSSPGHSSRAARRRDSRSSARLRARPRAGARPETAPGDPARRSRTFVRRDRHASPNRAERICQVSREDRVGASPCDGHDGDALGLAAGDREEAPRARARGTRGRPTRSGRPARRGAGRARAPRAGRGRRASVRSGARPSRTRASTPAHQPRVEAAARHLVGLGRVGEAVAEDEDARGERGPQRPRATCWRRSASKSSHSAIGSSSAWRGVHEDRRGSARRSAFRPAPASSRTARPAARRRSASERSCVDLPEPSTPSNVMNGTRAKHSRSGRGGDFPARGLPINMGGLRGSFSSRGRGMRAVRAERRGRGDRARGRLVPGRRLRRPRDRDRLDRRHVLGPSVRRDRARPLRPRGHRGPRRPCPGSPAEKAGIKPGECVQGIGKRIVKSSSDASARAAPAPDRREGHVPRAQRPLSGPAPGGSRGRAARRSRSSSPPSGSAARPTSTPSSSGSSSSSSASSSSCGVPQERSARIFFLLCVLFLLFFVCRLRPASYWWIDVFVQNTGTVSLFLLPAVFLHFFLVFPRPKRLHFAKPDEWTGDPPAALEGVAPGVPVGEPGPALPALRDPAVRLPLRRVPPGAGGEGHGPLGRAALLLGPARRLPGARPRRAGALGVHAARSRASGARPSTSSSARSSGRSRSSSSSSSCRRPSASTSTPSTGSSR